MDNGQKVNYKTNSRLKANVFSKLFLCWIFPYLSYGKSRELKTEDIFELAPENRSEVLGNKLEKCWTAEVEDARRKQRRPSFLRLIVKTFGCNYLRCAVFSFISMFSPMLLPLVLKLIISHFDENSTSTTLEAYFYILLLALNVTTESLLTVHSKFSLMYLGRRVKTASSALIYKKLLKLPAHTQDYLGGGKLITLLTNDVTQFEEAFTALHVLVTAPLQLVLNVILMARTLGSTTVFAVLIVILQHVPFRVFSVRVLTKLREKTAQMTDSRLLLMNEIISGIRVIKMYTWEKPFEQFALLIRRKELDLIAKKLYFHIGMKDSVRYGACVSLYLTIAIMISQEVKVTSLIIFPLIHYNLNMNDYCGYDLFSCFSLLADSIATVNRIEDFLLLEELVPNSKLCTSNNSKEIVTVKNATASLLSYKNRMILENFSVSIFRNKCYALVGETGSGKSSLLKLILGEIKPQSGQVFNYGDISYANQEPWLFNGSIRSNILFGESFNEEKYNKVISSCALLKDIEQLPYGDKTVVGERGAALSGGQSARINLASLCRAVYRNADVYLLDDPLASVDYDVAEYIFENCIKVLLKNKVIILVTQKLEFIKKVDEIILINNGRLEYQGEYATFQNTNFFHYLLKCRQVDTISVNMHKQLCNPNQSSANFDDTEEKEDDESNESEAFLRDNYKEVTQALKSYADPLDNVEQIKQGKISLSIFKEFYDNKCFITCTTIFVIMHHSCIGFFDYLVTKWSQNQDNYFASLNSTVSNNLQDKSNLSYSQITLFYIIGGVVILTLISAIIQLILLVKMHRKSSEQLHANMISSVLNATIQFFDINDSGRILNRFSQDLGIVDEQVALITVALVKFVITIFIHVLQILIASPYMSVSVIISLLLMFKMTLFFGKFIRSLRRLEARAKALVLSHSNATFNGLVTIRALHAQSMVQDYFYYHQDNYTAAGFTYTDIFWTYNLWIKITSKFFLVLAAVLLLLLKSTGITSATVGHIMLQIYVINLRIGFTASVVALLESFMISTERTIEYTKLNQENITEKENPRKCANTWPSGGRIKFDHLFLKYSNSNHPILKNINFVIEPGTKVGIVGRTGAGKSSLIAALFRLAETQGSLFIDDVNVKSVTLKDLRSSISILPQNPTLFFMSLRNNLDPLNLFDDAKIWAVLKSVRLDNVYHSLDEELDHKSLSSGQRQLLCLARAILKKNKILILDEPATNTDACTDDLIHNAIKENFKDSTSLIIAHKLNSVLHCDKILVIDAGQVIEFGEPQLLLQQENSYFCKMWHSFKNV